MVGRPKHWQVNPGVLLHLTQIRDSTDFLRLKIMAWLLVRHQSFLNTAWLIVYRCA